MNRYLEYLLKLKLFVAFLLLLSNGYGQEISTISIESSLKIAGANNLTISKLNLNKTVLEADLLISKGWWIPEIFAGIQTRQLQGAAMNGNGSFFTDVNQQNLWNGVGIDALWNIGEGIYKTKASELKLEANTYKTTAEKNIVLLDVADTYYQLLIGFLKANAYHQLHAVADNISQQLALQVGVGLAYESELLLAQSNVHHLKIQELNQQKYYYKKSAQLSRLLNLNPFNNLIPIDTILKPIELVNIDSLENLDSLGNNRAEIQEAKLLLKAISAEKLTTTKAFFIPNVRLNSFGSLYGGLLGPVSLMPSSPGSEIKQLYPTTSLNFSLQWKIPIEKLIYNGPTKKMEASEQIKELEIKEIKAAINQDIVTAKQNILINKQQTELANKAYLQSKEAFNQCAKRQELGTIRPFELLQAQEIFIQSKLDYIEAIANFNTAQYAFQVATGINL